MRSNSAFDSRSRAWLVDVESGEIVLTGLSMPHSPRWFEGRLWVLESGKGTLSVADLEAGTVETVAELPGFTRGLLFAGGLAGGTGQGVELHGRRPWTAHFRQIGH